MHYGLHLRRRARTRGCQMKQPVCNEQVEEAAPSSLQEADLLVLPPASPPRLAGATVPPEQVEDAAPASLADAVARHDHGHQL